MGSSQPLFLGLVAAVIGFGGYKVFTGRQGQVASKPGKAARGAKRQVQVNIGVLSDFSDFSQVMTQPSCLILRTMRDPAGMWDHTSIWVRGTVLALPILHTEVYSLNNLEPA